VQALDSTPSRLTQNLQQAARVCNRTRDGLPHGFGRGRIIDRCRTVRNKLLEIEGHQG
jgi:hypothetical protein